MTVVAPSGGRAVPEVLGRGAALGALAGALSGATAVLPLVLVNGPPEALLVYPPLAALPGAGVGVVVGVVLAALGRWVSARRNGAGAATGTASPGSSRGPGR